MPRQLTQKRRDAEKQFLRTLITIGQYLGRHAPTPHARQAAHRVLRRLRILSGMP